MPGNPNDDAIERLSKKLYSAHAANATFKRSEWHARGAETPSSWKPSQENQTPPQAYRRLHIKPVELLFGASVGFFIIALVAASLLFWGGGNTVSTRNVDIQITGPTEIGAGSTLSLQVVVTNRNAVPIENADLVFEFPEGTRSDQDISVELPRLRESLGTLEPGESVNRSIRAVLFGVQGSDLDIEASVEYSVPSSNAVFVSEALYTTRLNESPAAISIDAFQETVSGQRSTYTVSITSNAPEVLSDTLLVANFPPGFSFEFSSPAPASGNSVWNLGDIEPGGTREITITGVYSGEDGESRVTHFVTGAQRAGDGTQVAAPLATSDLIVTIQKPFISLSLTLDNESTATYPITRGKLVRGTIHWTNNLPVRVQNVSIQLSFEGQILDRSRVEATEGFFNSSSNTILWDKSTSLEFADVAPGQSGTEVFQFAALPVSQGSFKNPEINLSATVRGNRLSESNVPEVVESSATAKAVVLTDLLLEALVAHGAGDAGPIPPKVDTPTAYTTTWKVTNTGNAVGNARVTAVLPSYVAFSGGVVPGYENVTYNDTGRLITWTIGDLAVNQTKTVTFKINVTPSIAHVGSAPIIISDQQVSGLDRYVRYTLQSGVDPLTTEDAATSPNGGLVVQ